MRQSCCCYHYCPTLNSSISSKFLRTIPFQTLNWRSCARGALEMVHLEVAAWFAQDNLRGDNVTELRVKFIRKIEDTVPAGDD